MNDAAVEKQISNMVSFIKKEAHEKASEIKAKAEQEFTIEKAALVTSNKQKIAAEFEKKEKGVIVSKKIAHSNELARSRLEILKARDSGIVKILDQAKTKLDEITQGAGYRDLLVNLMVQALSKFEVKEVSVQARQEDQKIVLEAIPLAKAAFEKQSGSSIDLTLSSTLLPPSPKNAGPKAVKTCSGGVILTALNDRIVIDNTLDKRLETAYHHAIPQVRKILFGEN